MIYSRPSTRLLLAAVSWYQRDSQVYPNEIMLPLGVEAAAEIPE